MTTKKDKKPAPLERCRETREVASGGFASPHDGTPKEWRVVDMPAGSYKNNSSIVRVADDTPLSDWQAEE